MLSRRCCQFFDAFEIIFLVDNLLMSEKFQNGQYIAARQVVSPNFDQRPDNTKIEALIIHSISLPPGEYQSDCVERFFCNQLDPNEHPYFANICHLTVSSHFFIKRDGEVVQFVNANKRAWHAGQSFCLGRENANDFSIGIELEGWDEASDGFASEQYASLIQISKALIAEYSIQVEHIFGHSDIAPERKNDPGAYFDWQYFRSKL